MINQTCLYHVKQTDDKLIDAKPLVKMVFFCSFVDYFLSWFEIAQSEMKQGGWGLSA